MLKQISVVLKNVPGQLADLSVLLGKEGVNIRAISVADTSEVSTVRIVVDEPAKALNILKGHKFQVYETEVLAVETPDHPGGLTAVVKPLKEAKINVHYLYPFLGRASDQAIVILGVDKIKEAEKVLKRNWVHTFGREIYNL
ncbi:MAG: ACT domain-containing protein [Proteobacteria bacterium]|nr:ACT domain-containing protein [Pseudomonadota bacterium]